jgi:hypothetical protein
VTEIIITKNVLTDSSGNSSGQGYHVKEAEQELQCKKFAQWYNECGTRNV